MRLKGAEENLLRLEDVLRQIDAQIDGLKRQARQAQRYKGLAAEIRRNEALALHIAWRDGEAVLAEAGRRLEGDTREVSSSRESLNCERRFSRLMAAGEEG